MDKQQFFIVEFIEEKDQYRFLCKVFQSWLMTNRGAAYWFKSEEEAKEKAEESNLGKFAIVPV